MRVAQVSLSDTLAIQKLVTSFLAADAANLSKMVDDPARLAHAAAAARLSGGLPLRERTLINGLLAHAKKDYARACAIYGGLVRADSSDIEALYGQGECLFQDEDVEVVAGDTSQVRFRSSWNSALRVLRSILRIDPSFHLAFDDVESILTAPNRLGCRRADPALPCNYVTDPARYRAVVRRDGDSLLVVPAPPLSPALAQQEAEAERTRARWRNLEEARHAAEEWVAAAPRETRAHRMLLHVLIRLGRLDDADAELADVLADPSSIQDPVVAYMRMNVLVKRHRGSELIRVLDSLNLLWPPGVAHAGIGGWSSITGRLAAFDSLGATILKALKMPPILVRFGLEAARVTLGVGGDSAVAIESRLLSALFSAGCNALCVTFIAPNLKFGLRLPRARWPAIDSAAASNRAAPAWALSRGDTAALRTAARRLDSLSRAAARSGVPEDGTSAIAADALLMLGDSLAALNAVRRTLDSTLVITPLETLLPGGLQIAAMLWPRAMLQRADLAAGLGERDEARLWYGRFLELWAKADPEFQPIVERARRAYRALGGS